MDSRKASILFAITAIPATVYYLRPDIMGVDGYFYLMQSGLGFKAAKLLLWASLYITVLGVACLGELFFKENGWRAGVFAFLSPALVFEFAKFETESFAFPLLVWTTFFLFKSKKEKKTRLLLASIALTLIAALLWQGTAYYILAFSLVSPIFLFGAIPLIWFYWQDLVYHATPYLPIAWENRPITTIKNLWFLMLGVTGVKKSFVAILAFFLGLAILNAKFVFLPIPFLAVGFVGLMENPKAKKFIPFAVKLSFIIALASGIALHFQPPSQSQWQAIEFAKSVTHPDYEMQNDWELGYWVRWTGGFTQNAAGGPQFTEFDLKGTIVTKQVLQCNALKTFDYLTVYDCG